MTRTFTLSVMIFLLLFIGWASLRPSIVALVLPLLIYMLIGLWHLPDKVGLKAERSLSAERVKTGDEVSITLKITNFGSSVEELLLQDQVPPGLIWSQVLPIACCPYRQGILSSGHILCMASAGTTG